jgi:hypothetical protein
MLRCHPIEQHQRPKLHIAISVLPYSITKKRTDLVGVGATHRARRLRANVVIKVAEPIDDLGELRRRGLCGTPGADRKEHDGCPPDQPQERQRAHRSEGCSSFRILSTICM